MMLNCFGRWRKIVLFPSWKENDPNFIFAPTAKLHIFSGFLNIFWPLFVHLSDLNFLSQKGFLKWSKLQTIRLQAWISVKNFEIWKCVFQSESLFAIVFKVLRGSQLATEMTLKFHFPFKDLEIWVGSSNPT
jgi:hypothetical protein